MSREAAKQALDQAEEAIKKAQREYDCDDSSDEQYHISEVLLPQICETIKSTKKALGLE